MKNVYSILSCRVRSIAWILVSCLLLAVCPQKTLADNDVYLLTAETINGTAGNYQVPSNHKFTNVSGDVYSYTITSMPATEFYFRVGVNGWDKQMQPYRNGDALAINGNSYIIKSKDAFYGSDKAWKVSYTAGEYTSLTITIDISSNRYLKVTGIKKSDLCDRTFTKNVPGTVWLPFDLTSSEKSAIQGTFYEFTGESNGVLQFTAATSVNAYVPYVFVSSSDDTTYKPFSSLTSKTWTAGTPSTVTKGNFSFTGSASGSTIVSNISTTYYGYNSTGFVKIGTSKGATVPATVCYFSAPTSSSSAKYISFIGGTVTGVVAPLTTVDSNVKNAHVYNLAGQRVGKDYKGVVIINGKKVIRK